MLHGPAGLLPERPQRYPELRNPEGRGSVPLAVIATKIVAFRRAVIGVFFAIIVAKMRHPEPATPLDAATRTGPTTTRCYRQ